MALTPRETQDMITLQRQVAWQYDLDNFTEIELKKIQRSVNLARNDIGAYFSRRGGDIGAWTKERLDDSLNELQAMTIGIQGELTDDISTLYGQAGSQAFAAQANMLSFGGRVPGMNFVALAPAQLKAMASEVAVGGQLLNSWVDRSMGMVLQEQLRTEVLAGMLKGEGYQQFVKRLEGKFTQFSQTELTTLVRTYVQEANVRAQTSIYKANPDIVKQVKWSAVLEPGFSKTGRGTCPRCAALDGQKFDMDMHPLCPLHARCRCILLPVTKSYRELGLDIDEIEQNYRPYTIRNNKNIDAGGKRKILEVGFHKGDYGSWFNKQSKSFKRNVVGPKRLDLIESGKVKFNQLVSPSSGRLYNLDELAWFNEVGWPDDAAKYAGMSKIEKAALRTRLLDKGPYPDLDSLQLLTGQEVKMLGSGLDLPTFGKTRAVISDDIVTYYKGKIVKPPVKPPGPITPLPEPGIITTQVQLDEMTWSELRKFGSNLGIKGKHPRPEWSRLILEKVGDTTKLPLKPKVVPIPTPGAVDYKALSWTEIRAYGKQLGISGKYKRPDLEDMIADALKKGAGPVDVKVIIDKADNVVVAKLTPQDKMIRQQNEFDDFFKDPDQKGYKQFKYPQNALKEGSVNFEAAAPALAQHQRLLEARVNYMRWLKETDFEKWETVRKGIVRKQLKFTANPGGASITQKGMIEKLVNKTHRGTAHIDDGLFLELDRGGLKIDWQMPYGKNKSSYRAFYKDSTNTIRLYDIVDEFDVVAHEYGHAVDRWLTGRSSNMGSGSGREWADNMFVSKQDGQMYRSYYNKQRTGEIGKFSNGDGNYDRGNWIKDYEGRIYKNADGTVGEQFWAMGSQRYAKYDDLMRSGKWEKLTNEEQWNKLARNAFAERQAAEMVGDQAEMVKWSKLRQDYLDNSVAVKEGRKQVSLPKDAKNRWAASNSGWDKQKTFYPGFADMQERMYKTKWTLKNDPMWEMVLEAEEKYNLKMGNKNILAADVEFLKVPASVKPPKVAKPLTVKPGSKFVVKSKKFDDGIWEIHMDELDDVPKGAAPSKAKVATYKPSPEVQRTISAPQKGDSVYKKLDIREVQLMDTDIKLHPKKYTKMSDANLVKELENTRVIKVGDEYVYKYTYKYDSIIEAQKRGLKVDAIVIDHDAYLKENPIVKMVDRSDETFTSFSALDDEMKKWGKTLEVDDRMSIWSFVEDVNTKEWNAALRKNIEPPNFDVMNDTIDKIERLPRYTGKSYRGIEFKNKKLAAEFIDKIEEGGIYVDEAFMSSSADAAKIADDFVKNPVVFEIRGKSGRAISQFNEGFAFEKEIVFTPDTKFDVISKKFDKKTKTWSVVLEELDDRPKGAAPSKAVAKVDVNKTMQDLKENKYNVYDPTDNEMDEMFKIQDKLEEGKKVKSVATEISPDEIAIPKNVLFGSSEDDIKRYLKAEVDELAAFADDPELLFAKLPNGKYFSISDEDAFIALAQRSDISKVKIHVVDLKVRAPKPKKVVSLKKVYTDPAEVDKAMKKYVKTLDDDTIEDIGQYIDNEDSYEWNVGLRGDHPVNEWSSRVRKPYESFMKTYDTLPTYEGVSYRGVEMVDREIAEMIENMDVGNIYVDKGLVSTSTDRAVAESFADFGSENTNGILFKVNGKSGKPISAFSLDADKAEEFEILFRPDTKYVIKSKKKTKLGWVVELDELDTTTVAKKKVAKKVKKKAAKKVAKTTEDVKGASAPAKKLPIDPEENYVRDGNVFKYKGVVVKGEVAERLKAMKLPPSWTDVVIDVDPNARIQAAGIAKNGKVQPRYADWHIKEKAIEKFNRQRLFSSDVGTIRGKMEADILKRDPRAMLLKIEDETVIRIGTDADLGAKKKAYGLTTLQHEHVKVSGNRITFDFVAKEGVDAHYEITDARLADWLQERIRKTKPGEKLFPDVPAGKLNKYLKDLAGGKKYSIKDYRTFHGTRIAYEELQPYVGKVLTDVERKKIIKEVSTKVSDFLHNTPDMAKKSYIDPMVWELIGGA